MQLFNTNSFIIFTLVSNIFFSYIPDKWILLFAHADWLARRWLAKYYSPPSSRRKTKWLLSVCCHKVTLWAASYTACVVYTKTIIHLGAGESGEYLPPLRWIIVNYFMRIVSGKIATLSAIPVLNDEIVLSFKYNLSNRCFLI